MEKTQPKLISVIIFILAATATADDSDDNDDDSVRVFYAGVGQYGKLYCNLGERNDLKESTERSAINFPKWSFIRQGKSMDVPCDCEESKKNKEIDCAGFSGCKLGLINDDGHWKFALKLRNVSERNFGEYLCHTRDGRNTNITYLLNELPTVATKDSKGRNVMSITTEEDDILNLYCNATGLTPSHKISWWKKAEDENITDITEDLQMGKGDFEGFTENESKNGLNYSGIAKYDLHRGYYTCQVDLNHFENNRERRLYPVNFTFFARVREPGRWQLPVYVFVGEVVLIALITLIVSRRERREDEAEDGNYEDSDDEDEVSNDKNGGINNNAR